LTDPGFADKGEFEELALALKKKSRKTGLLNCFSGFLNSAEKSN
jgi:hypothetical protein